MFKSEAELKLNKITTIEESTYFNKDGNITNHIRKFDGNFYRYLYVYNSYGKKTTEYIYNENGRELEITTYTYDLDGKLVEKKIVLENSSLLQNTYIMIKKILLKLCILTLKMYISITLKAI